MNKPRTLLFINIFLCSVSFVLSKNNYGVCSADISIESMYDFDTQKLFDKPQTLPLEVLECYRNIVRIDIEKNEVLLKQIETSRFNRFWSSLTQKLAALSVVALTAYDYYSSYYAVTSFRQFSAGETFADIVESIELSAQWPGIMERINKGERIPWGISYPRGGWQASYTQAEIERTRKWTEENKLKLQQLMEHHKVLSVVGPLTILSSTLFFGYSMYRARAIQMQKEKLLEVLYRDKEILKKLESIE